MKRKRPPKVFRLHMKKALLVTMAVIVIVFAALIFKVFYIIETESDSYKREVLSHQTYVSNALLYKRGEIRDRNGTVLALSVKVYDLVISPKDLFDEDERDADKILENQKNREFTLQTISELYGIEKSTLDSLMEKFKNYKYAVVTGAQNLDEKQMQLLLDVKENAQKEYREAQDFAKKNKIKDWEKPPLIKSAWFEEKYTRSYPLKEIACNVVGFDNGGSKKGIELTYDEELTGSDGREYGYYDSELNLQRTIMPATDGNNIICTIDANAQRIVEQMIRKEMKTLGADHIAVLIMNPQNGEILAMASNTQYDPNDPQSLQGLISEDEYNALTIEEKSAFLNNIWNNFCVHYSYEPGSTFKPFVVAAALDEGTTNPNMVYTCNGRMTVGTYDIGCANRIVHGAVTPKKALMESCNVSLMQIVEKLGRTQFYKYMNIYGFGRRTGIDLDGEAAGITHKLDKLNTVELATSSFGQTQNVTMVQMLSAFSSLINGGKYYEPHLVKEIRSSKEAVVKKNKGNLVRNTITEHTSELIREYLKATVSEGTAVPAQVPGYDIGGKTGTAEKHGAGQENDYIVSFIGFTPTDDPELAIYVLIDEPHVEDQSHSTYATQFASRLMKKVLPFLGVYPDGAEAEPTADPDSNDTEPQSEPQPAANE